MSLPVRWDGILVKSHVDIGSLFEEQLEWMGE